MKYFNQNCVIFFLIIITVINVSAIPEILSLSSLQLLQIAASHPGIPAQSKLHFGGALYLAATSAAVHL